MAELSKLISSWDLSGQNVASFYNKSPMVQSHRTVTGYSFLAVALKVDRANPGPRLRSISERSHITGAHVFLKNADNLPRSLGQHAGVHFHKL